MPEAYDQDGVVNQEKRFAAGLQRDPGVEDNMNPFAEQEAWEEHQIGKATLKFGSKNKRQTRDDYHQVLHIFSCENTVEGRKNAYHAIVHARPRHLNNIHMETQWPGKLLKRAQLTERWARWEITNFDYLMELNILAGRSYNDITQYPVFPWILADYCSKTLDLGDSSSYRDLSKPIGALNPDRLKKFQERYSTFKDPTIPKFHYGSHYSSAATMPAVDGYTFPHLTKRMNVAGRHVTSYLSADFATDILP